MSSGYQQHFTSADIDMLDRVLGRAGMPDVPDPSGKEDRLTASRFLIETFQHGITDESALFFALAHRPNIAIELAALPMRGDDGKVVFGAKTVGPVPFEKNGYRYGRRVELNGTWTIYHVFSGEQASHDSWNMAGLNVKTADRVLRLLNAPSKAA